MSEPDFIHVATEECDNDGNPIYVWVDRKTGEAVLDNSPELGGGSFGPIPETVDAEPSQDELRRKHLLSGLGLVAHGFHAKDEYQKACRLCGPIAKAACSFYQQSRYNSGGQLAITTSTYRNPNAPTYRANMNRVLKDITLDISDVPCKTMFDGKKSVKGYSAEMNKSPYFDRQMAAAGEHQEDHE